MSSADTSMYQSMIRPTPQESPIDLATKAMALKTAMGRAQMQPLEVEQTRLENEKLRNTAQAQAEDRADTQTLQQIYGQVQNDASVPPEKKLEAIRERAAGKVKPRTLEALSKQIEDHATQMQKLSDDHLKQIDSSMKEVGNTAAGILSAPAESQAALYATERARLIKAGVATEDQIPEQFDPNYLRMAADHAMGAQNAATAEMNRRKDEREQDDADRKAHVADLATAGQEVGSIQSQDDYTAWRDKLPPKVKALTAATWSPQNVATIKRMGLSAEQQQQADQSATTAAETKRHDEATESNAGTKPTFTGDLRAALVATGAKDPDNPTPEEAGKALDRVKPAAGEKPVSKATLTAVESRKSKAIRDSKAKLDKEVAGATINGKVLDQSAIDQAWEDHINRLQDAQLGYESELTAATGNDVGHNDWADKLRAPGSAAPKPSAAAPGAQPGAHPNPAAKQLVSKYKVGQQVKLKDGRTVTIKSIDPETGDFEY